MTDTRKGRGRGRDVKHTLPVIPLISQVHAQVCSSEYREQRQSLRAPIFFSEAEAGHDRTGTDWFWDCEQERIQIGAQRTLGRCAASIRTRDELVALRSVFAPFLGPAGSHTEVPQADWSHLASGRVTYQGQTA